MMTSEKPAPEIVCLVDDDSAVLKSIGRLLASDGFSARSFDKPKDFLAHVQTNAVPLVVLDLLMGEMSGLEVQARIAAHSPHTRVIVITGREDPKMKEEVLRAGAVAFFSKPFDDGQFLGAVRAALACRSTE
ncbi:MAG TPA: response regulator [Chthoniobacterales bacterium]|nr:response regulator [Chthoniobacterales bacterium]